LRGRGFLAQAPSLFEGTADGSEGVLWIQDGKTFQTLPPDLEKQGVLFMDLHSALESHGDRVAKYLYKALPSSKGKFEALNAALWSPGIFLYVPKGVDVGLPLRGGYGADLSDGQMVLPRTLIVVESGARVTYFDEYASPGVSPINGKNGEISQALSCAAVEIFLAPDAELRYVNIQRWGQGVFHFLTQNARLEQNARLTAMAVALGSALTKADFGSDLVGQGAVSRLYGLVFGDGAQHFTHHTWQDHRVPNTTSDLLFKAALKDKARSIFTGMVRIAKEAQKSDAYQACRNMLLSPHARANAIPMLEILADDVKCGHGAAVGTLDEDQRFYLMARGLDPTVADHMIVEGFFEEVLQKLPSDVLRDSLRKIIQVKLSAARLA
jgi:Fe-S cluster assembly protein SufD